MSTEQIEDVLNLKQADLVEISATISGGDGLVATGVRRLDPSEIGPVVEKMQAFLATTGSGNTPRTTPAQALPKSPPQQQTSTFVPNSAPIGAPIFIRQVGQDSFDVMYRASFDVANAESGKFASGNMNGYLTVQDVGKYVIVGFRDETTILRKGTR